MVFTPAFINLFLAERGIIIISVVLLLFLFVLKFENWITRGDVE